MKAIETVYNGYRFRSRLEARWAVFFDAMGIKYLYEPEGFEFEDGTRYLPDFYLPESKSWFEVKGEMDEESSRKIDLFVKEGNVMTIGYYDFEFNAMDIWGKDCGSFAGSDSSWLCECFECGHKYFIGLCGSYRCPCCGAYDGDSHFFVHAGGWRDSWSVLTTNEFEEAEKLAKQKRFEYGE